MLSGLRVSFVLRNHVSMSLGQDNVWCICCTPGQIAELI